jgi:hypothetical protein
MRGAAFPARVRGATLRLLAGLALAVGPYAAHVLPLLFHRPFLFRSLTAALVVYVGCGALCGLPCRGWCVACAIAGIPMAWAVLTAARFLQPRDTGLFLAFATVFAVAFAVAGCAVAALAWLNTARVSPVSDAAA